jgi:hypothetical protein
MLIVGCERKREVQDKSKDFSLNELDWERGLREKQPASCNLSRRTWNLLTSNILLVILTYWTFLPLQSLSLWNSFLNTLNWLLARSIVWTIPLAVL